MLAYRNLDIGLWHRLVINPHTGSPYLSSRRLLVILRGLPEKGRYKTARRGGRQSRAERVVEELYNETALLRASFYAVNGGPEYAYEPMTLADPVDEMEQARREAADAEAAKTAQARFEADIGFVL